MVQRFIRLVFNGRNSERGRRTSQDVSVTVAPPSSPPAPSRVAARLASFRLFKQGEAAEGGPHLVEYLPDVFRSVRDTYGVSEQAFKSAWGAGLELKLNDGGSSQVFELTSFFLERKNRQQISR